MPFEIEDLLSLAVPLSLVVAGLLLGVLLRRTVLKRLAESAKASPSRLDDIFVAAVRGPIVLWFLIAGLYVAVQITPLSESVAEIVGTTLVVLIIASVTWALGGMAVAFVRSMSAEAEGGLPGITLISNITRIIVLIIGFLVILQTLGISIAPVITALGIGGLAVALALQDTLANLFAGVHILAARQVRPGDYVLLDTGEEGFVMDVTWRQTTIRQLPNNLVIVPNSKLAAAIVTNTYLPEKVVRFLVPVGVHYDSDLEHVERVTIEVARGVMEEVEGGVPDFEPFIRYHTFGDFAIGFNVFLRAREHVDHHPLKHEFIKRLHRRYREEGIVIPFPIRTVEFRDGPAGRPRTRESPGD